MNLQLRLVLVLAIVTIWGRLAISPVAAATPEQQVVDLVNTARAQQGLAPLTVSSELTNAAESYADAMATDSFFAHQAPNGSTFITRDEAAGYRDWSFLGENIAAGQTTPQQVVAAWLASPEHRANVLSAKATQIGVGQAYRVGSPYGYYWVQEFGARFGPSIPTSASTTANGWTASTGHTVSGAWLDYLRSHGDVDNLGLPRTDVIADPTTGGQTVQYFQRAILEWHPENPPGLQIERRLLGDILYPGADPPLSPSDAPPGPYEYFPFSANQPTGLGHFVANYTRTGQLICFKDYFDSHGGVSAFGYPKEEPKLRNGLWTQRFQAAVFEYHPEFDRAGNVPGTTIPLRNYRVQLELLGDEYIHAKGLPYH